MSIKLATKTTIVAGHYVCAGRSPRQGHCTGPRLITKVQGTRLHFEREGKPTYFQSKDALYVCDTEAEGEAMFELTQTREKQVEFEMIKARLAVVTRFEPAFAALITQE